MPHIAPYFLRIAQTYADITRSWVSRTITVPLHSIVIRSKAENVDLRLIEPSPSAIAAMLQTKAAAEKA